MDQSPFRIISAVADEHRSAAAKLVQSLLSVARYASDFRHAVELFELSRRRARTLGRNRSAGIGDDSLHMRYESWMLMAARDGAITLYNFRHALDNSTMHLKTCGDINGKASQSDIRALKARFEARFSTFTRIRHGVAHEAEFSGQPNKHAVIGGIENIHGSGLSFGLGDESIVHIPGALVGDTYTATVNGKLVGYEINSASLVVLESISQDLRSHLLQAAGVD